MIIETIVYLLLALWVVSNTFVFRYQRTTLSISRILTGSGNKEIQTALTPSWIGLLGWCNTALGIALLILVFIVFSWLWSLVLLAWWLLGTAIVDVVTPLPSYKQCFAIIERSLKRDSEKQTDENIRENTRKLLESVKSVEKEFIK